MTKISLHESLRQNQSVTEQTHATFTAFIQQTVVEMVVAAMQDEVTSYCGPSHSRQDGEYERGGSAMGRLQLADETLVIGRPRVRRKQAGTGREVPLAVYQEACDPRALVQRVIQAYRAGASTRAVKRIFPQAAGVSPSQVSRHWQAAGEVQVAALRERSLAGLDFELGASENEAVCTALIARLLTRGLDGSPRRLILTDGGKGLLYAIRKQFPNGVLQRCLVHKERNLRGYLSHKHYGLLGSFFKRWRHAQGLAQALAILGELRAFLKRVNAKALASLDEAGEELLGVFLLELPNTLHESLLSTNCIENTFLNLRRRMDRVTRWRANTTMAERWLAYGLMTAEGGFRRIKNFQEMPVLLAALTLPSETLESRRAQVLHCFSIVPRA